MQLYSFTDPHFTSQDPFYSAQLELIEYIVNSEFNNFNNYLVISGDLFDKKQPDQKTNVMVIDFLKRLNFKKIYILSGNHDHEYNFSNDTYAIDVIRHIENVECIYGPQCIDVNESCFLMLPWIPNVNLKEYYENLPEQFSKKNYDIIFHHLEDETCWWGENIDLSCLKTKYRSGGHLHVGNDGYLGSVIARRSDEKDWQPRILEFNLLSKEKSFIEIPKFIKFIEVVDFDDIIDFKNTNIYTIINAVDSASAKKRYRKNYPGIHIGTVILKSNEVVNDHLLDISADKVQQLELLKSFCTEKNVKKNVKDIVFELIK
jgi:hypothetical protein